MLESLRSRLPHHWHRKNTCKIWQRYWRQDWNQLPESIETRQNMVEEYQILRMIFKEANGNALIRTLQFHESNIDDDLKLMQHAIGNFFNIGMLWMKANPRTEHRWGLLKNRATQRRKNGPETDRIKIAILAVEASRSNYAIQEIRNKCNNDGEKPTSHHSKPQKKTRESNLAQFYEQKHQLKN